jgi:chemotaxis family two-component system response regulator Rcp1
MKTMPQVLLVEDNPADMNLVTEMLSQSRCPNRVSTVSDGEEALAFLHRQGKYADEFMPDLVLLDLSLPRKDGRAVLAEVKADPALRKIPIVVFSTSQAPQDISLSYELGANGYVCKPGNLHEYLSAIQSITEFWFGHARLPRKEDA